MARHQQAQSSSHWQKAGYEAGVELKRLRRSLAGAEQRLIQRAGEQAHWMRLGLLLLKVLVAVAVVGVAAVYAFAAFCALAIVVAVLGAGMLGGGRERDGKSWIEESQEDYDDWYYYYREGRDD